MKKLINKLTVIIMAFVIIFSISIIPVNANMIKGYGSIDRWLVPRVEYEFTGPHALYIHNTMVKRNILRQKIYDSDNNYLQSDKAYIPLDDILCEIRCHGGYQVYDNGDMIKFTATNWRSGTWGEPSKWLWKEYEYYIANQDDNIRSLKFPAMHVIKYQDKYYIDIDALMSMTSIRHPYYNDILDAAMFASMNTEDWLITTPEYRDALMERYHKIEKIHIPLDKFKDNCSISTETMFKTYLKDNMYDYYDKVDKFLKSYREY